MRNQKAKFAHKISAYEKMTDVAGIVGIVLMVATTGTVEFSGFNVYTAILLCAMAICGVVIIYADKREKFYRRVLSNVKRREKRKAFRQILYYGESAA